MKRILSVVGARPNFIKLAPVDRELATRPGIEHVIVHTGQHYDSGMSDAFFEELWIPTPDYHLGVGSGSHAFQTAAVMQRLEPALAELRPDLMLVYGDVNSTLAAALVAAKLGVRVGHVEAGLRSGDWTMPEEINRVVTDRLSDLLFIPSRDARSNLAAEGVPPDRVHFVGNVMIDALEVFRPLWTASTIHRRLGLSAIEYGVVTLHRPTNVDDGRTLRGLIDALLEVSREIPLVFPVHPRTLSRLSSLNGTSSRLGHDVQASTPRGLRCVEPLGYPDFMALVAGARVVLTDSGGLQEETTALGVPCLTLRENTERPVTVTHGTNRIVGTSARRVVDETFRVLQSAGAAPPRPPLWDGHAAERIVTILARHGSEADAG